MNRVLIGNILGVLILAAVALGLPYLAGAFVLWDWNAGNWSGSDRAFLVFTQILMSGLITLVLGHEGSPIRRG